MLVLNLPAFKNTKKDTAYDRFHGNGPYGKIPRKNQSERSDLPYHIIRTDNGPNLVSHEKTIPL